ncbi:MAG: hypothetical protein JO252_07585 [Planctomycetaceae bacterium]|nr:hypothetical protein [Planctomycetaceae bacterium]
MRLSARAAFAANRAYDEADFAPASGDAAPFAPHRTHDRLAIVGRHAQKIRAAANGDFAAIMKARRLGGRLADEADSPRQSADRGRVGQPESCHQ